MGHSGVDVGHVRWRVGGGPPAVLLQDILVGFGVKVCPPHQHLGVEESTSVTVKAEPRGDKFVTVWAALCCTRT